MSTRDIYMDTNIANYTLSELMAIIEVQELEPSEITKKTNKLINQFKASNPEVSAFFIELRSQLLQYAQGLVVPDKKDNSNNKIVVETYQNMNDDES